MKQTEQTQQCQQCPRCGEMKPHMDFRSKSTLKQALARGYDRPYPMMRSICAACRAREAIDKAAAKPKLTEGGRPILKGKRKALIERISYATAGITNEHAYALEGQLERLDGLIQGRRAEAQHARWRKYRLSVAEPVYKGIDNEIVRMIQIMRAHPEVQTVFILERYIELLRRAKIALDKYVNDARGQTASKLERLDADSSVMTLLRDGLPTNEAKLEHDELIAEIRAWAEGYALDEGVIKASKPLLGVKRYIRD